MVRWKLSSYTTVMVSLRNIDSVLVTDSLFSFKNVKKRPDPPYTPFKLNSVLRPRFPIFASHDLFVHFFAVEAL